MSVSHASATEVALRALATGQNRDPFAVLGPHPDPSGGGTVIRAFHPAARSIDVRLPDGECALPNAPEPGRTPAIPESPAVPGSRDLEAVVPAEVSRLSPARHLSGRPRAGIRRSLSLRPRADRFRSASARRGHALPRVREARRAPHHGRLDDRRALRGVGAQRRSRQRDRRLQRLGRPRPPDAPAGAERRLGDLHPRSARRREIQVRDPHGPGRAAQEDRSVRLRVRSAAAVGRRRPRHLRLPVARRGLDGGPTEPSRVA